MRSKLKPFTPVILLFILLNAFFIGGAEILTGWNADGTVLIYGNLLLFVITFFSYLLAVKGLNSSNPHQFTRAIFSSMLLKLFIGMIAALFYIATYKKNLNKPALFGTMGLYLVYTFLEVYILTRMLKNKPNA